MNVLMHGCKWACFTTASLFMLCSPNVYAQAVIDPALVAGLMPHKALYDVRLSSKKSGSNISNISGTMFYEWQPTCDAWVSNHRFDMVYEYPEVPPVRITSDFSTHESFDGSTFSFTMQRKRAGVLYEELRGSVNTGNAGDDNEVVYSIPQGVSFHLPKGSLFPMAHTISVLDKIKQGKKFYNATIFDGSDENGPVDVNSFIGKEETYKPADKYAQYIDSDLVSSNGWNVQLAFFPLNNFEEIADYEMSLVVHENGVITDMLVKYKDFSITQKLRALEPMVNACVSDKNGNTQAH